MDAQEKIDKAMDKLLDYVGCDGGHHKQHAIVEAIKILAGDKFEDVKREYCDGENGPDTYGWDDGTA